MHWSFAKYVGCGNDFIFFDNRQETFPAQDRTLIQKLCHRQLGIGADGIILLEGSLQADCRMRIFNADGGEAEMCGNGLRCAIKFIQSLGLVKPNYRVEVMGHIFKTSQIGLDICVEMGSPAHMQWDIPLQSGDQTYRLHYLDTGVPHAVLFVKDVDAINLNQLGPLIRYHSFFTPRGVNVNFAQLLSNWEIKIRTYERGVEGETLACGTGATAVALAAAYHYRLDSPLYIQTASKECLVIGYSLKKQTFSNVTMTGPAYCTFQGEVNLLHYLELMASEEQEVRSQESEVRIRFA